MTTELAVSPRKVEAEGQTKIVLLLPENGWTTPLFRALQKIAADEDCTLHGSMVGNVQHYELRRRPPRLMQALILPFLRRVKGS